ncbi:hypothetical protein RFI_17845, partial [Reticulomyxa filosa]
DDWKQPSMDELLNSSTLETTALIKEKWLRNQSSLQQTYISFYQKEISYLNDKSTHLSNPSSSSSSFSQSKLSGIFSNISRSFINTNLNSKLFANRLKRKQKIFQIQEVCFVFFLHVFSLSYYIKHYVIQEQSIVTTELRALVDTMLKEKRDMQQKAEEEKLLLAQELRDAIQNLTEENAQLRKQLQMKQNAYKQQ